MAEEGAAGTQGLRKFVLPGSIVLIVAIHVVLTIYFEPLAVIFGEEPISHRDFHTHAEQAWRVTEALDGWGRSWAYDVQLLAGYPNGTVFDTDNKAWELWTFVLWKTGLARGTAFNLFILLAHLMLPAVVLASARLMRLDWWSSAAALGLSVLLWFFDSLPHTCWWIGMQAFAIIGTLFLLPLALMYRYLRDGGWWRAVLLGAVLAFGHLVHPYIFLILLAPMLALYIRSFRKMPRIRHVGAWAAAAFALFANLWWIVVALEFWHYVLDSGYFGSSTLSYILSDYLGLLRDPSITGNMENRTGFRIIAIGAAVAGLVSWRRSRDDRFLPFVTGLAAMAGLVYLGGYFWITQQVQPYRFLLPLTFTAIIPAASFIGEVRRSEAMRRLPKIARTAMLLVALVALPYLARDVLYFMPVLMPGTPVPEARKPVGERMGVEAATQKTGPPFRRWYAPDDLGKVALWLDRNYKGGRILVENPTLGEYLARATDAPILGGFQMRNMQHSAAFLFRRHPDGDVTHSDLERYLSDYAVSLVIMTRKIPEFEFKDDLLEPEKWIPPHRIYSSRVPWSYFETGAGEVYASMNRIEVKASDPRVDVVLRFHWLETLVCAPDCTIERKDAAGDPVGFIKVSAPHPADFVIENGY
jgi:hypothetical protein